jgi:hypothetical protein
MENTHLSHARFAGAEEGPEEDDIVESGRFLLASSAYY